MKIVIVCILKFILISTASSQTDVPCHVCEYSGVNNNPRVDITFSTADIPKRCKLVTYGYYYFDGVDMDDINMYNNDETAIRSMVEAGIPVYTYVTYNLTDKWNTEIFEPQDPATYDNLINPLIEKLNELKPTGIILNIQDLYDGDDLANKIKAFITKLKPQFPELKFGLSIYTTLIYENLPKKELFDFSVTNSIIDLYFADMDPNEDTCTPKLLCDGTPITSQDEDELSMEFLSNVICQSAIDKAKIIACINIAPITPHQFDVYSPYSEYCDDLSVARAQKWCIDKSQKLYDMGAFVKKQEFGGVAVDWLEWDDVKCQCECDKFPVTNLIFDGWDAAPIKPCPKIDRNEELTIN